MFDDRILYLYSNIFTGLCTITPEESVLLLDSTLITCDNWEDAHLPLKYHFYMKKGGVAKSLCISHVPVCNVSLPSGEKENAFRLHVYVDIIDSLDSVTTINKTVTVSEGF